MNEKRKLARLETGVRNLDELLRGGLPAGTVTMVCGAPGSGKTILTQQICFHNASPQSTVLYFSTLSEPTAKTLRYLSQFSFFDPAKFDRSVKFFDLGVILRNKGLEEASSLVMERVKKLKPAIVVIDSFRAFDDLARSKEELRKFGYELTVQLMAWEVSAFLLGEYSLGERESNPLFSIIDGMVVMSQRAQAGEQQRLIQLLKMRGTDHSRDEHPFMVGDDGIEVFAPRVLLHRQDRGIEAPRLRTGLPKLDLLLGEGIPRGSSLLVAGVSGTGKTVLLLEFLYRGALLGEKGIFFSFEETEARLRSNGKGLGWDLDAQIERGMIEIVFIPQPQILVEANLLMMRERIAALGARRVAIDSVSVFLHKVGDAQLAREKVFQLCTVVQNTESVGLFATDIPYGSDQISRFGVEETVVDGVIVLTSTQEGLERHRYIEIYKLRNTAHLEGRHSMAIGPSGLSVFPRYGTDQALLDLPDPALERLISGVPGLDPLLGGGLLLGSVTLLSGSAGIGKSTMALQFVAEGVRRGEPCLYISLEQSVLQLASAARRLALPLQGGLARIVHLSRQDALASQLPSRLVDQVQAQGTRRLVLDGLSHLVLDHLSEEGLRQLLSALVARLRALGVTSLFTIEPASLYSSERVTDRSFSPIADNLVVLRYFRVPDEILPSLMVVKTRGSRHDFGVHHLSIDSDGASVGPRLDPAAQTTGGDGA
jgi:circadian clock protein KaiC